MTCETQLDAFMAEYNRQLEAAKARFPGVYHESHRTFRASLISHSFYKDRPGVRKACIALGIPHTYSAIYAFVEGRPIDSDRESEDMVP